MPEADARLSKKERKIRRKKLLRVYREDQKAIMWNKVVDEVGGFSADELDWDCYTFDFLDSEPDPDFEDPDEDYPNKLETLHNLFGD